MAITLETAVRNALANAIDTEIGVAGYLEFATAANAEVATITFSNPAFGTAASGTITMTGQPLSDTNATGSGTAVSKFRIFASGAVLKLSGTVSTTGADINMSSTTVGVGDTVQLTSFSITVP